MIEEAETYTLPGSYYNFRDNLTSILMLNNKGALPLQIAPIFYSLDGAAFQIAPLTVNAASYREINVSELLANAPEKFREGNLQISYEGGDYQLGSQLKIIDFQHSLIWEEQHFPVEAKYVSANLEGVWWLPSTNCETKFVMTNTTGAPVTATVKVDGTLPPQILPKTIQLDPHQTRVLDVIKDLVGLPIGVMSETGGVSISHTGVAGAVMARMLVSKPNKGFSSTMHCIDPQMTASSRWHGAGLRIGKIGNYQMEQVLAVRNAGAAAAHIKGKFYYTKEDGAAASVSIPRRTIAARSSKTIDLQNLIEAANLPANIKYGGIEMEYDTAPGSVIVSSLSHSKNENLVFQVPIYDPEKTASSAGGYPWKTDGDYTTLTYAKNDTNETQKFILSLKYETGGYTLGVSEIKPHQTLMVDFKALRDSQTPDITGSVIPLDVSRGQINWTIKGDANHKVNGRSEQFSLTEGLTSTYDCRNCCPDSYFDGAVFPYSISGYIGDITNFTALESGINCYGYTSPYYYAYPYWGSSNFNVENINSSGTAKAVGIGNALIQGEWSADIWTDIGDTICKYESMTIFKDSPAEVLSPSIDSIDPAKGSVGGKIRVSIDGSGLTSGTIVNPIPGITFSDYDYGLGTGVYMGVVFNISGNATPGNNSVSVSKAGANSNSVDFFVQKPVTAVVDELFNTEIVDPGPGDIVNAFDQVKATGICGAYRNILYTLVDQNSEPLDLGRVDENIGLQVTEILSDYQSPSGFPPLEAKTELTNNIAKLADTQAVFQTPPCPPAFSYSLKQKFKVVINSVEFLLTIQNVIAVSHPSSGQWTITITILTP